MFSKQLFVQNLWTTISVTPKEVWSIRQIDNKELTDVKAAIASFRQRSFI